MYITINKSTYLWLYCVNYYYSAHHCLRPYSYASDPVHSARPTQAHQIVNECVEWVSTSTHITLGYECWNLYISSYECWNTRECALKYCMRPFGHTCGTSHTYKDIYVCELFHLLVVAVPFEGILLPAFQWLFGIIFRPPYPPSIHKL